MSRNPRHDPPWGDRCEWPPAGPTPDALADDVPRIDTADARKARSDPNVNEAAAHDARRARQRVIENRRASYYRGSRR